MTTNYAKEFDNIKTLTYLIKDNNNNIFKIGRSKTPYKRFEQLKTANPFIELIGVSFKDEKFYHNSYKKYRISGEWFNFPHNFHNELINLFIPINQYNEFMTKKTPNFSFNDVEYKNIDTKLFIFFEYNLECKNYDVCREMSNNIYRYLGKKKYRELLQTNDYYRRLTNSLIYLSL